MAKKKVELASDEPAKKMPTTNQDEQQEPTHTLPNTFEMFAKKKNTAFIAMTQEASMKADESAVNRKKTLPSRINSCIHKIRETE